MEWTSKTSVQHKAGGLFMTNTLKFSLLTTAGLAALALPVAAGHSKLNLRGSFSNAYAVSDVVISRAGASSISELCLAAKAAIFVPSPNVAEDHQTKNAMALVNQNAALLVKDDESRLNLIPILLGLLKLNMQL